MNKFRPEFFEGKTGCEPITSTSRKDAELRQKK